jgi:hypothetical protein
VFYVWENVCGDCMEGVGRALLFKTVNDEGEYHHNYFIQTSLLSTNNTLSLLNLTFLC